MLGPLKLKAIDASLQCFQTIRAYDALECLQTVFGAGQSIVYVGSQKYQLIDLYDMMELYEMAAKDFQLDFYGGPPPTCKLHQGTLFTMLVDHFLYKYTLGKKAIVVKALEYATTGYNDLL